jgi:putative MATE family efflux protein
MRMKNLAPPMNVDASDKLATGSIGKLLLQYSIPAIIATSVESIYNIIDRVFIGHGVGAMAISGLAVTFPMMNLAAAFGAMVGVGAAALVSIRLGERNQREANAILGNTLFLNVVISTVFSVVCFIFLDRILLSMGASKQTLPYAKQFIQIILLGNVFTHVYLGLNNVMRASGYPLKAMINTLVTVGVNLALAPLFIFAFRWGIRGAALATVCAQVVGSVWALLHFMRKGHSVRFCAGCFKPELRIIRDIFSIGLPSFIMLFCASFIAVLVNLRLTQYGGDYAIGAYGILTVLAGLFVMITVGLNMGMQPIVGYNFGAAQFDRARRAYRLAVIAATCITTFGFLLGEIFPRALASVFTSDPQLIDQIVTAMRFTFLLFPVIGFQMVTSSFFQSIGKARVAIVLSLSRQVLFLIPFLIVLPLFWGLNGVWAAGPASDLTASVVTFFVLKAQMQKNWRPGLSAQPE